MTVIYYQDDVQPDALDGQTVAVIGYGNQGRSWSLNLRDSGLRPRVCVRADESREMARADGFDTGEPADANDADIVCVLIPDDAIPELVLQPADDALTIVASGYALAFDQIDPPGDQTMIAPRMLGPEVRRCFTEGVGFISAVGVHRDRTGRALARTLAVADAIGALHQGAIALTPRQEAVLDLAVEQVLSPALTHVNNAFVQTMLANDIPLEAIITELVLSGEVERSYRLLREVGFAVQLDYHSPTSQYGQLSRRGRFDHLDTRTTMDQLTDDIVSGRFASEWAAEAAAGHPTLASLRDQHAGPLVEDLEVELRRRLGPGVLERRDHGSGTGRPPDAHR
ncbi:MAG: ketol-acid reductoisomerase [Acidimicrobiia bacterium]|nr:ketol-acid reductoisomerase [Acidimicrobiia bacterium]